MQKKKIRVQMSGAKPRGPYSLLVSGVSPWQASLSKLIAVFVDCGKICGLKKAVGGRRGVFSFVAKGNFP